MRFWDRTRDRYRAYTSFVLAKLSAPGRSSCTPLRGPWRSYPLSSTNTLPWRCAATSTGGQCVTHRKVVVVVSSAISDIWHPQKQVDDGDSAPLLSRRPLSADRRAFPTPANPLGGLFAMCSAHVDLGSCPLPLPALLGRSWTSPSCSALPPIAGISALLFNSEMSQWDPSSIPRSSMLPHVNLTRRRDLDRTFSLCSYALKRTSVVRSFALATALDPCYARCCLATIRVIRLSFMLLSGFLHLQFAEVFVQTKHLC